MIKFSYLRDPKNPKIVLTIAREIVKEKDGTVGTIQQFSLCGRKDQFSKKIGRKIASGRLEKNPLGYYVGTLNPGDSPAIFAMKQIEQFCKDCSGYTEYDGYRPNATSNHYSKIIKILNYYLDKEKVSKK